MTARMFRIRPYEVAAVQWRGDNADEVREFTGAYRFQVLDDVEREHCGDPEATGRVLDDRNSSWRLVYVGEWIVRVPDVGFVKMSDSAFRAQFDEVATEPGH